MKTHHEQTRAAVRSALGCLLIGAGLWSGLPAGAQTPGGSGLAGPADSASLPPEPAAKEAIGSIAQPVGGLEATWELPAQYSRNIGPVSVLQVRPDIYMLTVDGVNVAVHTGEQATVVVNTVPAVNCQALVAAVKEIARAPIRYLVNTSGDSEHVECNAQLSQEGRFFVRSQTMGWAAHIVAHKNVVLRLIESPTQLSAYAYPNEIYTRPVKSMFLNGQAIQAYWMPNAHSDGDSFVVFRRSDVVVTGDILDLTRFPVIDLKHGGSIDGELAALNRLLGEFAVTPTPKFQAVGGTLVIPARGQLAQQMDVLNYRDMISIIRQRVKAQVDRGASLQQVLQSDPAGDYAPRFGADSGDWTTKDFVTAVYESLKAVSKSRRAR